MAKKAAKKRANILRSAGSGVLGMMLGSAVQRSATKGRLGMSVPQARAALAAVAPEAAAQASVSESQNTVLQQMMSGASVAVAGSGTMAAAAAAKGAAIPAYVTYGVAGILVAVVALVIYLVVRK